MADANYCLSFALIFLIVRLPTDEDSPLPPPISVCPEIGSSSDPFVRGRLCERRFIEFLKQLCFLTLPYFYPSPIASRELPKGGGE